MGSYSLDLRERIVKASVEEGQSNGEITRRFGVSRWSVRRYLNRAAAGSLAPTPHRGRPRRLDRAGCELLRAQVEAQPDWSLEQHAAALTEKAGVAIKKSSVGNYLKRLGIRHKKRASSRQSGMKHSAAATVTR